MTDGGNNLFDEEAINALIYAGLRDDSIRNLTAIYDLADKIVMVADRFTGDIFEISDKLKSLLEGELIQPFIVQAAFDKAQQHLIAKFKELAKTSGEFGSRRMWLIRGSIDELEKSAIHYFIKQIGLQIAGADLPRQLTIVKSELAWRCSEGSYRFIYKAYLAFKEELEAISKIVW